jgi:undecaprenyl-diphosphatase
MLVGRRRPIIDGHPPLGPAPTQLSFPSGHTTSAFAAATALSRIDRKLTIPAFALAKLIGVGRPYLGMHYPSDVLAGAVLGWAIGRAWPLPPRESEVEGE